MYFTLNLLYFSSSRDSYGEEMRRSSEHSGVYVGGGHSGGYGARREGRSYSSSDSLDDLGKGINIKEIP